MARPRKDGLDYYPMDVNFLGDIKVKKVIRSHGIQAVAVILHLLGTVYVIMVTTPRMTTIYFLSQPTN